MLQTVFEAADSKLKPSKDYFSNFNAINSPIFEELRNFNSPVLIPNNTNPFSNKNEASVKARNQSNWTIHRMNSPSFETKKVSHKNLALPQQQAKEDPVIQAVVARKTEPASLRSSISNQALLGQMAVPVIEDVINVTLYNPSKSQLGSIQEKSSAPEKTLVTTKKVI